MPAGVSAPPCVAGGKPLKAPHLQKVYTAKQLIHETEPSRKQNCRTTDIRTVTIAVIVKSIVCHQGQENVAATRDAGMQFR
jgi:hypothetical protein